MRKTGKVESGRDKRWLEWGGFCTSYVLYHVISFCCCFVFWSFCFCFSRQGFSVALEPVLELPLVDQVDLELRDQLAPAHLGNGIKGVCHHCPAAK